MRVGQGSRRKRSSRLGRGLLDDDQLGICTGIAYQYQKKQVKALRRLSLGLMRSRSSQCFGVGDMHRYRLPVYSRASRSQEIAEFQVEASKVFSSLTSSRYALVCAFSRVKAWGRS
jgi:hypothetical protein